MTIRSIIDRREISEIVHFTTSPGLLGILDQSSIRSRKRLPENKRLEYILQLNTPHVFDRAWVDYVNFSIQHINENLFSISSNKWHQDMAWVVLSFDPAIMEHEGVFFATTNNRYSNVKRNTGPDGLEALFAPHIVIYDNGKTIYRSDRHAEYNTTCPQAEVLYPGELSTSYLNKICAATEEQADEIVGQLQALNHASVEVVIAPEKFRGFLE